MSVPFMANKLKPELLGKHCTILMLATKRGYRYASKNFVQITQSLTKHKRHDCVIVYASDKAIYVRYIASQCNGQISDACTCH